MERGEPASSRPVDGGRSIGRLLRVVVVADDEVARAGLALVLGNDPAVGAVEEDSLGSAGERSGWSGVDVVVVDPFRPDPVGDQLAGVAVIERVRRSGLARPPKVVAVVGIANDDSARLRAREAGASGYVHRWWAPTAAELSAAILRPEGGPRVPALARPDVLVRLGITSSSRVNAAVAAAWDEVLVPDAGWVGPRGRNREARRARFNASARLRPVVGEGLDPDLEQNLPSIRQIRRVVMWATRPVELPIPPTPVAPSPVSRGHGRPGQDRVTGSST